VHWFCQFYVQAQILLCKYNYMIQLFCNVLKIIFYNILKDQKAQGKIYKCADHLDCSHQYRVQGLKDSIKYVVQTCGEDHNLSSDW